MEISSIIQSPSLVEIVNSTSNSPNIKKINEVDFRFDTKNFYKDLSSDYKSSVITENYDGYSNPALYDYQLQTNSPTSRINTSIKFFNEPNRKNSFDFTNSEDDDLDYNSIYEQTDEFNNEPTGSGFYYIFNGQKNNYGKNSLKKFTTEIQNRINKTYHLKNSREPGTLVNLIF